MDPSRPPPMVREFIENLSSSDRTDRTVRLDDMAFEVRYDPEPGVDMRVRASGAAEPDVVVTTTFDAAADRPPAYPPEMPYLPGVKVSLMDLPERAGASATWWMLPELEAALAGILAQSQAAGWVLGDEGDASPFPSGPRTIELTRPGQCRTIIAAALGDDSMITVIDNPDRE